ncbi:hypothetical protein [Arthrobacter sp. Cr_A7]|uniref:DUF6993 domain-containing protein n=1 Tax=Arthrobacter sp. Cr_A7 TaxID=3031017 RepID=UPI0023DAED73|nr:hypothetical protein [Arthrobacter sp. Cr_A7]MDF2052329.1 hypothetical protein [Arthrobacter sp. Cr_A7]
MRHNLDHRHNHGAGASPAAPPETIRARTMMLRFAAGAALVAVMAGCTPGSTASPGPADSGTQATETAAPAAQDSGTQDSSTEGNGEEGGDALADTSAAPSANAEAAATETVRQTVTNTLTQLAAAAPKPATAQVTDALTGAGIAPAVLQVSQSRTPTGLEADAIEAAVLQGTDCVIGQVREGTVTVTVLPVLASGKCFVGS